MIDYDAFIIRTDNYFKKIGIDNLCTWLTRKKNGALTDHEVCDFLCNLTFAFNLIEDLDKKGLIPTYNMNEVLKLRGQMK